VYAHIALAHRKRSLIEQNSKYVRILYRSPKYYRCRDGKCLNGAVCKPLHNSNGIECICDSGWIGWFCETRVKTCKYRMCSKGSTCVDKVKGFICKCPVSATGTYCETLIRTRQGPKHHAYHRN